MSVFYVSFLFQRPGCILGLEIGDYSQRNEAACCGRCVFSIMGFIVGVSCARGDHLLKDFDSIIKILMQWDSKDKHCWKIRKAVQLFWHMSCYLNCSLHYKAQPDESLRHLQAPGRCRGCGTWGDLVERRKEIAVFELFCEPSLAVLLPGRLLRFAQINKLRCKFCYRLRLTGQNSLRVIMSLLCLVLEVSAQRWESKVDSELDWGKH